MTLSAGRLFAAVSVRGTTLTLVLEGGKCTGASGEARPHEGLVSLVRTAWMHKAAT